MLVRIWTKAQTQITIKALRKAGYSVDKVHSGYECHCDGELVFRAMIGTNSYLIRYDDKLITG